MSLKKHILLFVFICLYITKHSAQSIGGIASGAQTYCDTINSGFVSITGFVGNVTTWQYSTNGGATWTNNGNAFSSQSYLNLKQSTCYRAIVKNGAFPPDTSTIVCITIYLPTKAGTITGGGTFCGSSGTGVLHLIGNIGNVLHWESSINNGSSWTTIANTTTSLPYSNITQNTIYRAIVQNSSFCITDTSNQITFTINPNTVAGTLSVIGSDSVCYAINTSSLSVSGNVGSILYWISSTNNGLSWSPISNNTTILNLNGLIQTTTFKTVVQSSNCNIDSTNSIKIKVLPSFTLTAGNDTTINQGQSVTLNGNGNGAPLWSPSSSLDNSAIFNPIATPAVTTNYILTVTDVNSCVNSDTVIVTVISIEFTGNITNVFSPNGDGINDNWYIENINYYPENEVTVYNIYGNIVFTKKGYNNDWQGTYNGKPLPDGTYFYVVKINESSTILKGSLDIIKNK
jgi:gliding motility-associated-like protein